MGRTEFLPLQHYSHVADGGYSLLPFRFLHETSGTYLLVNEVGEFITLSEQEFQQLIEYTLNPDSSVYLNLKSKHFLVDMQSSAHFEVLASKFRTKKSFLEGFTKLHIFVITLRCNQSCPYCQVSRQNEDAGGQFDIKIDALKRSIDLMLRTAAPQITMEFQGGEPLLNFETIKEAVRYTNERNSNIGKSIDFVVCTNLVPLTDTHLDFFKTNNISISTSLDGPAYLHDKNRPLCGQGSHSMVERGMRRAQEALGKHSVAALMTTTKESLKYPKEIVDEYLRLNMGSIFIRDLNPYGFAVKTAQATGYSTEDFISFYDKVLNYILQINRSGITFSESFASIILQKILTPWPVGFVDLQSPSGAGIGVAVYNYDGDVYASDESRMLAEMGDSTFRLGNVLENSYEEIFLGETMQTIASASCNEALAGCSDCVYQTYCGADPVRHYATQKDIFGNRASSGYCKKNYHIIDLLMNLIRTGDKDIERIFWAWIHHEDVNRMKFTDEALCQ